ncbi:Diacylglycerol lipase-beta-like protein [Drosera capensis]
MPPFPSLLRNFRWTSLILLISNTTLTILGTTFFLFFPCKTRPINHDQVMIGVVVVVVGAVMRLVVMAKCAGKQEAMAVCILGASERDEFGGDDREGRLRRRMSYIKWLWWSRFATVILVFQLVVAAYLTCMVVRSISRDGTFDDCVIGPVSERSKKDMLLPFMIITWFVALLQCFFGPDVLRWRSFYATHDHVWKAHYQEVFDHGIREALCCLGRAKYLRAMEEDEVHSVARLLGDLVTYRATGTGHLELLAGLALLQRHNQFPESYEGSAEAPDEVIQEATTYQPFAEAAYTGPLLDVGRNFILFPCAWFHRQGILSVWNRNRRPVLQGDNWWRGHAAAFLKYVHLEPGALRRGRVNQANCKATYFVVVLHHLKTVVVAVRGTESPEDLITDGLTNMIDDSVKQRVTSTFPHYGHSGVVEAARELFNQIDGGGEGGGNENEAFESRGFLSSILGEGCECEGYGLRIVGHSLGGAIAAVLGLRLHAQYPKLHVYAFGPLPCLDSVVADACSSFITSIIHDSEFSAYLSINSVLRLRAAALMAVSQDSTTDSTMLYRLARLFLDVSKHQKGSTGKPLLPSEVQGRILTGCDASSSVSAHRHQVYPEESKDQDRDSFLCEGPRQESDIEITGHDSVDSFVNLFAGDIHLTDEQVSEFMEVVPSSKSRSDQDPPELLLPGLVIHLVRQQRSIFPLWRGWRMQERVSRYKATVANRENFKDILVSPYMFLDHLPWRCRYALHKVLESRNKQVNADQGVMIR